MVKKVTHALIIIAAVLPFFIYSASADVQGQNVRFNLNSNFDKLGRTSMTATLRHVAENAYFYVDDNYWEDLDAVQRQIFISGITQLSNDFDNNIYPKETSFWGQEPKPGVDGDSRITILLEQLKSSHGGYFSTSNGYPKNLASESNEREMIVVNTGSVTGPYAKIFLAHEFQHLISFNQKELKNNTVEDVWLNELRSEYSITLSGYNDTFSKSSLENRAETFFSNSSDSLTEWPNVSLDYSLVALFGEYISEQYGENILKEIAQASSVGINSINNVLANRGGGDRFVDVFSKWLAASYINNTSINPEFGYSKPELKRFVALPQRLTILSASGSSVFEYNLKPWQVYGHKILIGEPLSGDKVIKLSPSLNLKFAYADNLGRFGVSDKDFYVTDPGGLQYLFIFPINTTKVSDFGLQENESFFTVTAFSEDKVLGMEFGSAFKDGSLIKKARESEIYVVEGKYKRYLRPETIALYGHLDPAKAIEVDDTTFNSYTTSNYVRYVDDERVYAIWPDGTKHWLNITARQWDESGRDWGAIFIINNLEINTYKTGAAITR